MGIYEPREDSELLKKYVKRYALGRVLDMGTGSGFQVKALLKKKKIKKIIGVDINKKAVDYCRRNIKSKKVNFFVSDLFSFFENNKKYKNKINQFETIIFNPPYLPEDKGISDKGIYGGKKGYEVLKRFLDSVNDYLTEEGIVLIVFSSLTGKEEVDLIIEKNLLEFEELEKKYIFFEELFVYLIKKSGLLKDLNKKKIKKIKYLTHGKRGNIFTGIYKNKKVAIKIKRKESKAIKRIQKEIKYLKILNKKKIGPKLLSYGENYLAEEFIEGDFILDWINKLKEKLEKENKEKIKKIIIEVLKQCFELDKLGINKEEMHRPVKHIVVDKKGKAVLLDFERCYQTKKPHNVTQFCTFLEKAGLIRNKNLKNTLKSYKREINKNNFKKVIKLL